jgi:hypothetical protein
MQSIAFKHALAGLAALEARNAKPNYATLPGRRPRNDQLGPGANVIHLHLAD